jgi:hypothetical protein
MVRVCRLLEWWGPSHGGGGLDGKAAQVQLSLDGESIIKRFTFFNKRGAGGCHAGVLGAWATRHARRGPVTFISTVELTGAVGAFLQSYTQVLHVPIFLTLYTSQRYANVFPDINKVVVDMYASCEHLVCCIWARAGHFEHGSGLVGGPSVGVFAPRGCNY